MFPQFLISGNFKEINAQRSVLVRMRSSGFKQRTSGEVDHVTGTAFSSADPTIRFQILTAKSSCAFKEGWKQSTSLNATEGSAKSVRLTTI
jgi:hypothetical protein